MPHAPNHRCGRLQKKIRACCAKEVAVQCSERMPMQASAKRKDDNPGAGSGVNLAPFHKAAVQQQGCIPALLEVTADLTLPGGIAAT